MSPSQSKNWRSWSAWCYDPFQLYTDGVITSPNILVLGIFGSGKPPRSRPCCTDRSGCSVRPEDDLAGARSSIRRANTARSLRHSASPGFVSRPGGPTRLNPLDAGPHFADHDELRARRTQMVAALAASALHRELSPLEEAALGWVMEAISEANDAAPTLTDVVDLLVSPTSAMCERAQVDASRHLARYVMDLRYGIGKLLDGQLRGMFDGLSTVHLD